MANFSAAEKTLIYELLDIPQITTYDWYSYVTWPGGVVTSVPFGSRIDFSTATTRLESILSNIQTNDGTDGRRSRISAIMSEYSDISLDVAQVGGGGGAGQPGARYNPFTHRKHLRQLLEANLGFSLRRGPMSTSINVPGAGTTSVVMR